MIKKIKKKNIIINSIIYLVLIVIMIFFEGFALFSYLENSFSDRTFQKPDVITNPIYIIGVDETSLKNYGTWEDWSREKISDTINKLNSDPNLSPAVIAIDVDLFSKRSGSADAELLESVKNSDNVILVSSFKFNTKIDEYDDGTFNTSNYIEEYETPYEELMQAAKSVGHANVQLDKDGKVRHAFGSINYNGQVVNSFDYEIYKLYCEKNGLAVSSDFGKDDFRYYIDFSGNPKDYYATSIYDFLETDYSVSSFKDGIVFIGAYASGMQDNYETSITRETQMYGVEVHANIVNQLINGIRKKEASLFVSILITLLICIICIGLSLFFEIKFSIPLEVVIGIGYYFFTILCYKVFNTVIPIFYPIISCILIIFVNIFYKYFVEYREKKKMIATFGKYLSPDVARKIADMGEDVFALGGIRKDIAVLFVDIRGFTTLSEKLSPEEVVEMLNKYFVVTTSSIFENEGTVDKFIGDATMGIFNAPLDLDDYEYKAVCAGLDMVDKAIAFSKELPTELQGKVGFGVGINCGPAIVGNIGTDFRMEYTAIGDTVNTASRLEGQAKAGCVIISEELYQRVHTRIECVSVGSVKLKGKANEVNIYQAIRRI